jgi:hypothetical protein
MNFRGSGHNLPQRYRGARGRRHAGDPGKDPMRPRVLGERLHRARNDPGNRGRVSEQGDSAAIGAPKCRDPGPKQAAEPPETGADLVVLDRLF